MRVFIARQQGKYRASITSIPKRRLLIIGIGATSLYHQTGLKYSKRNSKFAGSSAGTSAPFPHVYGQRNAVFLAEETTNHIRRDARELKAVERLLSACLISEFVRYADRGSNVEQSALLVGEECRATYGSTISRFNLKRTASRVIGPHPCQNLGSNLRFALPLGAGQVG